MIRGFGALLSVCDYVDLLTMSELWVDTTAEALVKFLLSSRCVLECGEGDVG